MTAPLLSPAMDKPEWLIGMEAVLEVLNEGVVITNEHQQILYVNSRFIEMTGISRQDLSGSYASQFYSPQEWDFVARQINAGFQHGHNRYAFVLPRKDGGRLPVIISSRTLLHSGRKFGIVTFTDISEQVRVTEELRSANAKLQNRQMEIEEDLRLAARVQNSLAPRSLVWGTMSVDAFYHPVHSIGGDFALVNSLDQDHLSLLVCDVSGHGIGSALVANRIYSETTAHLRSGMPFLEMFRKLNRFLIEDIAGSGMFVTLAAARIDPQRRSMVFAGAGHPPAMLARQGQGPLLLESRSMILGAFPEAVDATTNQEVQLESDDRIVLYTDGITEVFNSRGEMLGIEGVQEIVRQTSSLPPHEMKQGILDGVAAWREGSPTDDVSLMLVHVR
ncbi:MAG: response receiver sensor protein serine/threonine phosphatase, family [Acidobacteriaceae bacterium]|jgi:PAS domain S-box-containing protein|nr:response receiver sensor protein serine/threonine phosphatase, family [Acidobacteriaceae bacterium]